MTRYVLDTNLYVEASRDRSLAAPLLEFVDRFLPFIHLSAVVVQELLAGAVTRAAARLVDQNVVRPYERVGRVVTPSYRCYKDAGLVLAALIGSGTVLARTERGFVNDVLLAASCREGGFTLLTRNTRDFRRIAEHLPGFRFAAPYPLAS